MHRWIPLCHLFKFLTGHICYRLTLFHIDSDPELQCLIARLFAEVGVDKVLNITEIAVKDNIRNLDEKQVVVFQLHAFVGYEVVKFLVVGILLGQLLPVLL